MLNADIVMAVTGCPHVVLTRDEAEDIARERNRVALVIMDIGMPRDVDPDVHRVGHNFYNSQSNRGPFSPIMRRPRISGS